LRDDATQTSIVVQVHDGPPDGQHPPSIVLSADPCRVDRPGFAFCGHEAELADVLLAQRADIGRKAKAGISVRSNNNLKRDDDHPNLIALQ
jgi:hypothetical protein